MAVIVKTEDPQRLLAAIKRAIDDGDIATWTYDEDGDFTHTRPQWSNRAWLHPRVREDGLVFNIVPPHARSISRTVYGIYHGRFIEMLLNHFDERFTEAWATALPVRGDRTRDVVRPRAVVRRPASASPEAGPA
jgi:hypothetical protein